MASTTWQTMANWLSANPTKNLGLPKVHAQLEQDTTDAQGWKTTFITPATPLSAILTAQDEIYAASPVGTRKALLRDETTDLQEKAALHLKGSAWPMRKTAEGISQCGLEEERHSLWTEHGWRAICELRECQIVLIDEKKKEVNFYPEDIRTWSEERETFFIDSTVRCLYTPTKSDTLYKWLCSKEAESWVINWPLLDKNMKLEDIKKEAEKTAVLPDKTTKDVLRRKVGRAQSLKILSKWNTE